MNQDSLVFYHAPHSRSFAVRVLMEELQADCRIHYLSLKKEEQKRPEYLQINPVGKVPALMANDLLISESVAVFIYLADRYRDAQLAPDISHPSRGAYLRWLVQYGSCFDPAATDAWLKREPAAPDYLPYRDMNTQLDILCRQLEAGPYLLGETISAADILWGVSLGWLIAFGVVPAVPVLTAYVERIRARPAYRRAEAADQQWLDAQAA